MFGYPHYGHFPFGSYGLHYGPPSSLGMGLGSGAYEAQAAAATFQNLAYPIGNSGFVGGDVAGFDLGLLGHDFSQQLGTWGAETSHALGHFGDALGQGPLGDAPQRARQAADTAKLAADEARVTLRRLNDAAEHTSRSAQDVGEAARVAKLAIIGLSILGGAALIYSIAK